jgi:hypothetical protein
VGLLKQRNKLIHAATIQERMNCGHYFVVIPLIIENVDIYLHSHDMASCDVGLCSCWRMSALRMDLQGAQKQANADAGHLALALFIISCPLFRSLDKALLRLNLAPDQ